MVATEAMKYPLTLVYLRSSAMQWRAMTSLFYLLVSIISTLAGGNERTRSNILVPGALIAEDQHHRTGSFIHASRPSNEGKNLHEKLPYDHGEKPEATDATQRGQSVHKWQSSSPFLYHPPSGDNKPNSRNGHINVDLNKQETFPVHRYKVANQHEQRSDYQHIAKKGRKLTKAIASVLEARLRLKGNASLLLEQPERHRGHQRLHARSPPHGASVPDRYTHTQLTNGSGRPQLTSKNTSWQYRYETLDDFPDPMKDPGRCGRHHKSYLCDPYRMLTPKQGLELDEGIQLICQTTRCQCSDKCSTFCSGFKVAIAIIPSSHGLPSKHSEGALILWGNNLRTKTWKYGGSCHDDVLIVISVNEKKLHLSVGEKASRKLTGVCAKAVNKDAQGLLKSGKVTETLAQLLRDIKLVFENDFKCELSFISVMPTGKVIGIIFASVGPVILVVVILVFLGPCFRGRGFGGSSGSKHRSYYRRGYASSQVDMPWRNSSRNEEVQPANQTTGF